MADLIRPRGFVALHPPITSARPDPGLLMPDFLIPIWIPFTGIILRIQITLWNIIYYNGIFMRAIVTEFGLFNIRQKPHLNKQGTIAPGCYTLTSEVNFCAHN
jgi:hypothetical protein